MLRKFDRNRWLALIQENDVKNLVHIKKYKIFALFLGECSGVAAKRYPLQNYTYPINVHASAFKN